METKLHRVPLIAGNWKMNFTAAGAVAFAKRFKALVANVRGVEILICAPFTALPDLHALLSGTNVLLAAQNIFFEEEGTFTGEVSAKMIAPFCSYVIVGHSERRTLFRESNQDVNKKMRKALQHGIVPIVCVGESLEERVAGKTKEVLKRMVLECFEGFSAADAKKTVIAYEPVWAISKGRADIATSQAAGPETAQEAHAFIRSIVSDLFGEKFSQKRRIIYGGSMKPDNVKQLMAQKDIDGGLVGGASLDPESFAKVVKFKED